MADRKNAEISQEFAGFIAATVDPQDIVDLIRHLEVYAQSCEREAMSKMADEIKNEMPDIEIAEYGLGNTPHSIIDEVYGRLTGREEGHGSE